MGDLISRQDAIKVLKSNYDLLERATLRTDRARRDEISAMMAKIMSLPSADRPQGHYIKGESGEWYCSECKRIDDKYSVANFCWYCGARMNWGEEE